MYKFQVCYDQLQNCYSRQTYSGKTTEGTQNLMSEIISEKNKEKSVPLVLENLDVNADFDLLTNDLKNNSDGSQQVNCRCRT
jgi:hypothetical protein